jgi:hypothetical protein
LNAPGACDLHGIDRTTSGDLIQTTPVNNSIAYVVLTYVVLQTELGRRR